VFLPARSHAEIIAWSSTNLVNLHHDPAGSLVVSAFIPGDPAITWVILGALGLFTVNRLLGNVRTVVLLATAHVAGTLVSEGIVGYQVSHAILPQSARTLVDVGPSYVVVCALVAATLYGSWWERVAAGGGFAVLSFHIFHGLSHLEVTATGHVVAITIGAVLGGLLLRSARAGGAGNSAGAGGGDSAASGQRQPEPDTAGPPPVRPSGRAAS
jgi:Rhomboid-like protein